MSEALAQYEQSILDGLEQLNEMHSGKVPFNGRQYNAITELIEYWQSKYWYLLLSKNEKKPKAE